MHLALQHNAVVIIAGRILFVFVLAITLLNGAIMAASPRQWFRLPSWLRAQGTLTYDRHSSGGGALQVRLLGVLLVATVVWMIYEILLPR